MWGRGGGRVAGCAFGGHRFVGTARAGLDDALAAVQTISIGSAPRTSRGTPRPHHAICGCRADAADALKLAAGRPAGVRCSRRDRATELTRPAGFRRPGRALSHAMAELDQLLPAGSTSESMPHTVSAPFTICRLRRRDVLGRPGNGRMGSASVPVSECFRPADRLEALASEWW